MSGIVNARLLANVTSSGYTIEPEPCPAEHAADTTCYSYDPIYGTRQCPWFHWVGKGDTRRQLPDELAEVVIRLNMNQRHCLVMCELARRNRGPGLWPTLGAPKLKDEEA